VPPDRDQPLVTVVIPSHNHERFITEAIDSVLAQDYGNLELIVIDDGSTDGSVRIIGDHLAARSPTFPVQFEARNNRGRSFTVNEALASTTGPYFVALDSDDVLEPDMIRTLVATLETANPDTAAAFGDGWVIDSTGELRGRLSDTSPYRGGSVFQDMARLRFFPLIQASLIRRDAFQQAGRLDERFTLLDDWDMWLRLARRYGIVYLPAPVVRYRIHQANRSSTRLELFRDEARTIVHELLSREPKLQAHSRSIQAQLEARVGALYYNALRTRDARAHALAALRISSRNRLGWTVFVRSLLGPAVVERVRASRSHRRELALRRGVDP
jgi:alpha-1,3-rhamnosyltransferase